MEGTLEEIMVWFRDYKMPDGKPANKFGYDNLPQNRELAESVIKETHGHYQRLVSGKHPNTGGLYIPQNWYEGQNGLQQTTYRLYSVDH